MNPNQSNQLTDEYDENTEAGRTTCCCAHPGQLVNDETGLECAACERAAREEES